MTDEMILVLGVTASGKGRLAFDLAREIDAQIISVDSMKVYRRMDIGTAKPSPQARRDVNYHLIDVAEPSEAFSVGRFLESATAAIERIKSAGKPVMSGFVDAGDIWITPAGMVTDSATARVTPLERAPMIATTPSTSTSFLAAVVAGIAFVSLSSWVSVTMSPASVS